MRSKSNVLRSKFSIGLDSWFAVLSQRWSCSIVPISSRPIPSSPSGSGLFRTWFQSRSPLDPGPVRSGPDPPGSGLPIPGRPSQGPIRPGPDHVPFDVRTKSRLSVRTRSRSRSGSVSSRPVCPSPIQCWYFHFSTFSQREKYVVYV